MSTLLVHHATLMATMDNQGTEIVDGGLYIKDGVIIAVGKSDLLPQNADEDLNLDGYILFPGFINTHHHFYQTLTRVVPNAQNGNLFTWLKPFTQSGQT